MGDWWCKRGGIVYRIKRNFAESVFRKRLSLTVSLRGNEVGFLINKIFYGNCPEQLHMRDLSVIRDF
jgi:hypothetical protein